MTTIRRSVKSKQWAIERAPPQWESDFVQVRKIRRGSHSLEALAPFVRKRDWPTVPDDQVPDWVWAVLMAEKLK